MDWMAKYLSDLYFYLVYLIVLYISFSIIRDRKLFPARSSGTLVLLASLPAFFASYLFIRSLGGGHRYGTGSCGTEGCTYAQPLIYIMDNVMFILLFPLILFTVVAALAMLLAEIPRLRTERLAFDGYGIAFAGSLLFLDLMIGGYPRLKFVSYVFLAVTLVLLAVGRRYRYILCSAAVMYLYPVLYW